MGEVLDTVGRPVWYDPASHGDRLSGKALERAVLANWPLSMRHRWEQAQKAPLTAYLAAAVAFLWVAFAWFRRDPLYDELAILASGGMVFGAVWFAKWRPSYEWEPLRLIGFVAFAQAFLGSGFSVAQRVEVSQLRFTPAPFAFSFAVVSTFLFTSMLVLGIVGTMLILRRKPEGPADAFVPDWLAWTLAVAVAGYALASAFGVSWLSRLGNLPTLAFRPPLVLGLLLATQLLQKRSMRVPLALIFGAQMVGTLVTSMLSTVLLPVRDVFLTFFHLRKPFPWRSAVAVAAFLLLLNPTKHVVRGEMMRDGATHAQGFESVERAVEVWGDALTKTWSTDSQGGVNTERHVRPTLSRLDYNWATALIYSLVPGVLPFEKGGTYEDIPLVLVPRVLYPDKPGSEDYFRTRWTVRLGLLTWESAKRTAIAIPATGEAYWNFGWLGLLLVPLVLGWVFGGLLYLAPSHPVGRTGYVIMLTTCLGSIFDMLVWVVPQLVVVLVTAVLVRVYVRKAPPPKGGFRLGPSLGRAPGR